MAPHTNRSSHVTQNHHSWAGWIGPILRIHKAMGSFLSSINKPTEDFAAEPSGHAMTGHGVDAMAPGGAGAGAGDDVLVLSRPNNVLVRPNAVDGFAGPSFGGGAQAQGNQLWALTTSLFVAVFGIGVGVWAYLGFPNGSASSPFARQVAMAADASLAVQAPGRAQAMGLTETELLVIELAASLAESQRALQNIVGGTSIARVGQGTSSRSINGWVYKDPLFAPLGRSTGLGEGQFILAQAEGPLPGDSGVTDYAGVDLGALIDSNQQLLNSAARRVDSDVGRTLLENLGASASEDGQSIASLEGLDGLEALEGELSPGRGLEIAPGAPAIAGRDNLLGDMVQLEELIDRLSDDKSQLRLALTAAELNWRNAELEIEQLQSDLSQTKAAVAALELETRRLGADRLGLETQLAMLGEGGGVGVGAALDLPDQQGSELGELGLAPISAAIEGDASDRAADNVDPANTGVLSSDQGLLAQNQSLSQQLEEAQVRVRELEAQLVASLVDQRFAEAEYSRALARAERLTAQVERRANTLTDRSDLQTQLLEQLEVRYAGLLEDALAGLAGLDADLSQVMGEPEPLWEGGLNVGDSIGGDSPLVLNSQFDEFSSNITRFMSDSIVDEEMASSGALRLASNLDMNLALLEKTLELHGALPLGSPTKYTRISSHFGPRRNPVTGRYVAHQGIDLAAPSGTDVFTMAPGVVTDAGWRGGFGRFVEVSHGNGIATRYAHLREISVRTGQRLDMSDKVGEVGSSGRSTGPHLHYEIVVADQRVNPRKWIEATRHVLTQ